MLFIDFLKNFLEHFQSRFSSSTSFVHPQIGKYFPNNGIYMGLWTPRDENGQPIGFECAMFASRRDLAHEPSSAKNGKRYGLLTYWETVNAVAKLKNCDGHNGYYFGNETAYVKHLSYRAKEYMTKNGRLGEDGWFYTEDFGFWAIPPCELLNGMRLRDGQDIKVQNFNLFDLKNTGDFTRYKFNTTNHGPENSRHSNCSYWSSSQHQTFKELTRDVNFNIEAITLSHINQGDLRLSCRPVRVGKIRPLTSATPS